MPTASEHFSAEFEKWERRGRGWKVYPQPITPAPPLVPFQPRSMADLPVKDSGARDSFLGSIFNKFLAQPKPQAPEKHEEEEPEPKLLERDALVELQVRLPADLELAQAAFEQLFSNLSLCQEPLAFELLGTPKRVLAQFVTGGDDASLVRKQLSAYFPNVSFQQLEGGLEKAFEDSVGNVIYAVDFGLEREFMLPLASGKLDPFIGIVSALAELQEGELALFQVLWQPINKFWAESIVNSVTAPDGKPLFVNASELTRAAENKVAKPLYAVVVRMLVRTATVSRLKAITRELAGSLCAFGNPQGNALIPLHNDDYPFEEHVVDILFRQTRRSGMILNSDELTGFVHLPSQAVRTPELLRDLGQTKAAPITKPPGLCIGDNEHDDKLIPVYLSPEQRVRHTHIIGIPGTGKSSLLFNLIRQDIDNGDGVGVLDPHGDLIDQLLEIIPDDRIKDVVLVDLSDTDFPIGFNILQAHSEDEKTLLASDLVSVLRRFSSSWGDQMDIVLQNAILAFLESKQGGTLADLRRFLLEEPYRNEFLKTVTDLELIYYWQKVFPQLSGGKSIGSVLTRLQDFFSRKPLRNMVSQRDNKLDFADIMDSGKIFLAKLPEGLNGAENVHMLGSLLVSKFQQTAMARQNQAAADRKNFWLYVDEFDRFISPSMATILTGARKYRLGLTLAHQELHQLQSEPKVASAVNASVCTRIVLRVGEDDAKKLADGFESFAVKSLKNLENYHAIARIERNDWDFNLALRPAEMADYTPTRKAEVIAASRAAYGTPRADVEAAWLAGLGLTTASPVKVETTPPPSVAEMPEAAEVPRVATPSLAAMKNQPAAAGQPQGSEVPQTTASPVKVETTPPSPVAEMPEAAEVPRVSEVPQVATPSPAAMKNQPAAAGQPQGSEVPQTTASPDSEQSLGHTAIKDKICDEAEKLDYTATREETFPTVHARADVVLRRGKQTIICQVSDTNTAEYEADSIHKFLKLDFTHIAVVSINRRKLKYIQEALADTGSKKVGFYSPTELIAKLYDWALANPAGADVEKGKRRRQTDLFDNVPKTPEERLQQEADWLNEMKQIMKRKQT